MIRRVTVFLVVMLASQTAIAGPPSGEAIIRPIAELVAKAIGLEPAIAVALVRQESGFDPLATSPKGAMGLTQLMPATAKAYGLVNAYDPVENLIAGLYYYRLLLEKYRSPALALAAYNAGEAAVDRFAGVPPYAETRAYVQRILAEVGSPAMDQPLTAATGEQVVLERRPSPYRAPTKVDLSRLGGTQNIAPKKAASHDD